MEIVWKASPSDSALVVFGFALGEGVVLKHWEQTFWISWNWIILPKLKPLSRLVQGLVQGSIAHLPASSTPLPRKAPGPPASARDLHTLTKPDPTPPLQGAFSEKQDKSTNPMICARRLCCAGFDTANLSQERPQLAALPILSLQHGAFCSLSLVMRQGGGPNEQRSRDVSAESRAAPMGTENSVWTCIKHTEEWFLPAEFTIY